MAKKKKLNTNLDDDLIKQDSSDFGDDFALKDDALPQDIFTQIDPDDNADSNPEDITYNMGDIKVLGDDADDDEEFKKASQLVVRDSDKDGEDDDWIDEDEEFNDKDEDPFLDMAEDYDIDNPYGDY